MTCTIQIFKTWNKLYIQDTFRSSAEPSLSWCTHYQIVSNTKGLDWTQELWKCITSRTKARNTKQNPSVSNKKKGLWQGLQRTRLIHNVTSTCQSLPTISSKKENPSHQNLQSNHQNPLATESQVRGIPRCYEQGLHSITCLCKSHWQ